MRDGARSAPAEQTRRLDARLRLDIRLRIRVRVFARRRRRAERQAVRVIAARRRGAPLEAARVLVESGHRLRRGPVGAAAPFARLASHRRHRHVLVHSRGRSKERGGGGRRTRRRSRHTCADGGAGSAERLGGGAHDRVVRVAAQRRGRGCRCETRREQLAEVAALNGKR